MAYIQVRIDDKTKKQVQKILGKLGLDMSSAIKIYFQQIIMKKGIPFTVITENGFTLEEELEILKASEEARKGINVTKAMSGEEFIKYLHSISKKPKHDYQVTQKIQKKV